MVVSLDRQQLKLYQKVENVVYNMLASFFKNHLELIFMKFDRHLLEELFRFVTAGLDNSVFEVQSDCSTCINAACEFVHEKLKRQPTQKSAFLVQCVTKFYTESFSVF